MQYHDFITAAAGLNLIAITLVNISLGFSHFAHIASVYSR